MDRRTTHVSLLVAVAALFAWSAFRPFDRLTWILEVFPVILAVPLLLWLYRRSPFTTFIYTLIAMHAAILIVGGHYSYAEVPFFNWLKDNYGWDRNYYDRVGHFAQGFVPAMIARETLLRWTKLERGAMLTFLALSVAVAISAWYEILEFASAKLLGDSAENFLGTQGDVWDTQWDMTMCFIGAVAALTLLSSWHDRQLRSSAKREPQ